MHRAVEQKKWRDEAELGLPTSAGGPPGCSMDDVDTLTPQRPPYFLDPPTTPLDKPLNPMKKAQLIAKRKMEKEMKKAGKVQADAAKEKVAADDKPADEKVPEQNAPAEESPLDAAPVDAAPKKKRKPSQGPLQDVMKEFMKAGKAAGKSYATRLDEWKKSDERRAVVEKVGASESKRRRY
eukprot:Skav205636  [mRNA]  locus=scaffold2404:77442:77984:+ [translate_table: standard]